MLIVDNSKSNSKFVSVYGLHNNTDVNISSTYLTDKMKRGANSTGVFFNGTQGLALHNVSNVPKVVNISVSITHGGVYQGRLLMNTKEGILSVPVTVSTEPLIIQAIALVVLGVILAILLWELIKYFSQGNLKSQLVNTVNETAQDLNIQGGITNSSIGILNARLAALQLRYSDRKDASKQVIIEIGSIVLGITVGFLGLFSNTFITGIQVIDPFALLALIGLGLGIGSLKEFLDKT